MEEKKIIYYLMNDYLVAKREEKDSGYEDFLFRKGRWIPDSNCKVMDYLNGFDSSEPLGSPYRYGNSDILSRIEEITGKKAAGIMNRQIIKILSDNWKEKFKEKKIKWDQDPGWPAKLVETKFKLNGEECTILPQDLGLSSDPWDQGFMESIQADIAKDLKDYGAADIYNLGFLD